MFVPEYVLSFDDPLHVFERDLRTLERSLPEVEAQYRAEHGELWRLAVGMRRGNDERGVGVRG